MSDDIKVVFGLFVVICVLIVSAIISDTVNNYIEAAYPTKCITAEK